MIYLAENIFVPWVEWNPISKEGLCLLDYWWRFWLFLLHNLLLRIPVYQFKFLSLWRDWTWNLIFLELLYQKLIGFLLFCFFLVYSWLYINTIKNCKAHHRILASVIASNIVSRIFFLIFLVKEYVCRERLSLSGFFFRLYLTKFYLL